MKNMCRTKIVYAARSEGVNFTANLKRDVWITEEQYDEIGRSGINEKVQLKVRKL